MEHKQHIVHLVSEDDTIRESLGDLLESYQFGIRNYKSCADFLDFSPAPEGSCLILDLPKSTEQRSCFFDRLQSAHRRDIPVIILTERPDRRMREQVRTIHPDCHLEKPVDGAWLVSTVSTLAKRNCDGSSRVRPPPDGTRAPC